MTIEHVAWCMRQDLTPRDVLASIVPTMPPLVTWETVIRELAELCEASPGLCDTTDCIPIYPPFKEGALPARRREVFT